MPSNGRKRPVPPKGIEDSTKKRLHACIPRRIDRFDAGTAAVLIRLNTFSIAIRQRAFPKVIPPLVAPEGLTATTLELVTHIAELLHERRTDSEYDVLEKSIQETLFSIGDFEFEQKPFGRNVQIFVREKGCRGLIQLFLEMYLSNLILKQLHSSLRMPGDLEVMESLPDSIQELCRQAVNATTASWDKWPQLDEHSAQRLLLSLRSEMTGILPKPPNALSKVG